MYRAPRAPVSKYWPLERSTVIPSRENGARQRDADRCAKTSPATSAHADGGRDDGGLDAVVGLGIDGHVVGGGDRTVVHPRQRIAQDDVER
jgi:hypothetical protein